MGSMLIGSRDDIEYARTIRKMLGGGMRQVGVMAAMANVALQHPWRLTIQQDHENANNVALMIDSIKGYEVINLNRIQTNIFRFKMN